MPAQHFGPLELSNNIDFDFPSQYEQANGAMSTVPRQGKNKPQTCQNSQNKQMKFPNHSPVL